MTARLLGYGLLVGAAVLALLMLAWLAVSGAQGGGVVLGLILLVVLCGPLAAAGVVVLARQRQDAAAEAAFASKRRILDADRLFRAELAPELRQLARQPALPSTHLEEMAEDLERSSYDSPGWYEAVQLGDGDAATLQRYEDLVWDRVRRLRERATANAPRGEIDQSVAELDRALDQRRDLLVRGRHAPEVAPSTLLRAGTPARGLQALQDLAPGDAVSYDSADFLAEGVATYFAEGQTWKLVHLVPASTGPTGRWLYVGPEGLEVAVLDEAAALSSPNLPVVASGTATANVQSAAGAARGVLVVFTRYGADNAVARDEEWPDGARHTYSGVRVTPTDLEVWPASAPSPRP